MEERTKLFQFLDELRDSAKTNMFGAGAYLREEFGVDRRVAGKVVSNWMRTFDPNKTAAERASVIEGDEL